MKKVFRLLLCLLMVVCLLCGCSKMDILPTNTQPNATIPAEDYTNVGRKNYTHENITLQIPETFEDLSGEDAKNYYAFMVGKGVNLVMASKLENQTVEDYKNRIGRQTLSGEFRQKDGYVYFQYQSSKDDVDYVFDVGVYVDGENLWVIQVSALQQHYSRQQAIITEILDSVTVN